MMPIDINWVGPAAPLIPLEETLARETPYLRFHFSRVPAHVYTADLIIADERSYQQFCQDLQDHLSPPCMIIGASPQVFLNTLDGGCCDILTLPLCRQELIYRILKHARNCSFFIENSLVRFSNDRLYGNCGSVELSYIEYQILRLFTIRPGRVISRDLITHYTGVQAAAYSRSIDVHVSHLRKKIIHAAGITSGYNPIKCIRGKGYRIDKKPVDNLLKTSGSQC